MKLAFCSISALDRPIAAVARLAAEAGLDGIEIRAYAPHLDPEQGVDMARAAARAVRAAGIEVVAYGSYLGRFGQVTRAHAEREAALAAAIETRLLRVWAEPLEEGQIDIGPCVPLLRAACDAARPSGITVVIERHLGSFADTPERIERLLDAIDRPNVALNYQVLDFLPLSEVPHQAADAARLIRWARYVHLKNYQANPDGVSAVIPGGSLAGGVLDYRAILAAVVGAGYDGPLTIEFLAADERPVEEKLAADVTFVRALLQDLTARGPERLSRQPPWVSTSRASPALGNVDGLRARLRALDLSLPASDRVQAAPASPLAAPLPLGSLRRREPLRDSTHGRLGRHGGRTPVGTHRTPLAPLRQLRSRVDLGRRSRRRARRRASESAAAAAHRRVGPLPSARSVESSWTLRGPWGWSLWSGCNSPTVVAGHSRRPAADRTGRAWRFVTRYSIAVPACSTIAPCSATPRSKN